MCGVLVLRLFLWFLILLAALLFPYTSTSVLKAPMWLLHRMEEVERGLQGKRNSENHWDTFLILSVSVRCGMWGPTRPLSATRRVRLLLLGNDLKLKKLIENSRTTCDTQGNQGSKRLTHLKHLVKYHLCVSISCGFVRFCFLNGCLRGPSLMLCTRTSLSSPTVTTKWFSSLRSQVLRFCSSTSTVHAQWVYSIRAVYIHVSCVGDNSSCTTLPSCLHSSAMLKNGNQHAAQSSKLSWVSIPSIQGTICFWASLGVWPQIETIQQRLVLQGVDRQLGPQASTWDQSDWDLKIALKKHKIFET